LLTVSTIVANFSVREAPPTRNPSMSFWPIRVSAFASVTEPP